MKHYPIIVDGIVYESTKDLVDKLKLDIPSNILYTRYTKQNKEFTIEELNEVVNTIKATFKPRSNSIENNEINLGDVTYAVINTNTNFKQIEEFLVGIPVKGMPESFFINYYKQYYNKTKLYLPHNVTLNYLLEILDYYFKGEIHPNLLPLFSNDTSKKLEVRGKKLSYYAKEYGLKYNLVYTTYWDTKDLNNPEEVFIKQLEEKHNKLVQRDDKKTE